MCNSLTLDELRSYVRRKLVRLATFSIAPMEEDVPIAGNVLASGDDKLDRATEQLIESKLRGGNQWAWCTVGVEASWGDLKAQTFLGCCSYASERAFKRGGYYVDMKREVLDELTDQVLNSILLASQLGLKVHP